MRGVDIPQAPNLDFVRDVVALVGQSRDPRLAPPSGVTKRHVAYRYHAARILRLVEEGAEGPRLTPLGEALCATPRGSPEEQEVLRQAIRESPTVAQVAPDLLDGVSPTVQTIRDRILDATALSPATAEHRARDMLAWRRHVVPSAERSFGRVQLSLSYPEAAAKDILRAVTLKNFRSFISATMPFAALTVLFGPNAAGKSNAIDALRLMSRLAQGRRLDDLVRDFGDADGGLRGQIGDLVRKNSGGRFSLGATVGSTNGNIEIEATIECIDGSIRVVHERLTVAGSDVYVTTQRSGDHAHVLLVDVREAANTRPVVCTDLQPVFLQLLSPTIFNGSTYIPTICGAVRAALQEMLILDPEPAAMRGWAAKVDHRLQYNGANVSSALYRICQAPGARRLVLDFVKSLPEQDIRDIDFAESPRGEVIVRLGESFGSRREWCDAALLSDGTLRVLAIAAALYSVVPGSVVVIEEIDNGVHPSRASTLLRQVRRVAQERALRVLLTTHNPALLNAVPEESLPDVLCLFRDQATGSSQILPLGEVDRFPAMLAQGGLGDLVSRGVFERILGKPTASAEALAAERGRWIRDLAGGNVP